MHEVTGLFAGERRAGFNDLLEVWLMRHRFKA